MTTLQSDMGADVRISLIYWLLLARCPLASPTSAMLQETKRGSRYWRLRSAVRAAVTEAGPRDGHSRDPPALPELSSIPSKLEVRILIILFSNVAVLLR